MSTESEVVTMSIEIKDAAVSQQGFGVPLIAGYHTYWAERVRTFSDPDEMTVAPLSMPTTHPIYLAAKALKSQRPTVEQFKVGKRLGAVTHTVRLTPSTPIAGEVFSLKVDGVAVSVTADGTPTVAEITGALTTAITALTDVTATDNTTNVSVAGDTAGKLHAYTELSSNLAFKDLTANPATTIQTDLAAIRAYDSDWYALLLDSNSEAEGLAAAAWAESQKVLLFLSTADTEVTDGGVSNDFGSDLKTATYHRAIILWHHNPSQYAAAAWVGRMLSKTPGSATWANKSLSGVDKSTLSDTQRAALKAKNVNYYVDVKGVGFTLDGRAASGRYIDITHGQDKFDARVSERIVGMLANNDKVPYTNKGAQLARAQVEGQILEGIGDLYIDGTSPWSVTVPLVADVNPNDRIARTLPNVKFNFVLQGAVHKVNIIGTVRVAP
jgi:uncharacterized protein DUF3383